jgi:glucosamine-6-phosphate deaminase
MLIIETENYTELSKRGSELLINEISKKPKITIGFATGVTPLGMYKKIVKSYKKKKVDFSKVTSFNLDEYYSIKKTDKNSFSYYMFHNLFNKVNIKKQNINLLNGETVDPEKECINYEKKIENNPIDIQILGIGVNGHIGFNEPGSSLNSKTRMIKLTKETIKINSRSFKNKLDIPQHALTMGISTIMRSKKIILLASGLDKAKAVKCLVKGPISSDCPVSFLKKHRNIIVILDKNAARLI